MDYRIRMRNLREDSDKTQQEIATILETSQTMYARYERGANEMPIRHLIRLAQYYNVSTDYFLGLTKEKTPFPKKKNSKNDACGFLNLSSKHIYYKERRIK